MIIIYSLWQYKNMVIIKQYREFTELQLLSLFLGYRQAEHTVSKTL